jgi:hypothetical protein
MASRAGRSVFMRESGRPDPAAELLFAMFPEAAVLLAAKHGLPVRTIHARAHGILSRIGELERVNWATHEGRREPVFSEERHSAPTVLLKLARFSLQSRLSAMMADSYMIGNTCILTDHDMS